MLPIYLMAFQLLIISLKAYLKSLLALDKLWHQATKNQPQCLECLTLVIFLNNRYNCGMMRNEPIDFRSLLLTNY